MDHVNLDYRVRAVREMPVPIPEVGSACMPSGGLPAWGSRSGPPVATAECCWFHLGDWRVASAVAVEALLTAQAVDTPPEDIARYIATQARQGAHSPWVVDAVLSLAIPAWSIAPDGDGYLNGSRRLWVMIEQGVPHTVVTY